jgi:tetratricopeptide (TPR) repeat protein
LARAGYYTVLEQFEAAISDLEMGLSKEYDYADGWKRKGNLHFALGQIPEAIMCYRNSILHDPSDTSAWNNLSISCMFASDFAQVKTCIQKLEHFVAHKVSSLLFTNVMELNAKELKNMLVAIEAAENFVELKFLVAGTKLRLLVEGAKEASVKKLIQKEVPLHVAALASKYRDNKKDN